MTSIPLCAVVTHAIDSRKVCCINLHRVSQRWNRVVVDAESIQQPLNNLQNKSQKFTDQDPGTTEIFPVLVVNSLCKNIFLIFFLANSLCFPCLEKGTFKFPVFPVPWQPCGMKVIQPPLKRTPASSLEMDHREVQGSILRGGQTPPLPLNSAP